MKRWVLLALLLAHALASTQAENSSTHTVHFLGPYRKLRLHTTPRRTQKSTPASNGETPDNAASSSFSDDLQQLPSTEVVDNDGAGDGENSQQPDKAPGDPDAEDTELSQDKWDATSSDLYDY